MPHVHARTHASNTHVNPHDRNGRVLVQFKDSGSVKSYSASGLQVTLARKSTAVWGADSFARPGIGLHRGTVIIIGWRFCSMTEISHLKSSIQLSTNSFAHLLIHNIF